MHDLPSRAELTRTCVNARTHLLRAGVLAPLCTACPCFAAVLAWGGNQTESPARQSLAHQPGGGCTLVTTARVSMLVASSVTCVKRDGWDKACSNRDSKYKCGEC